MDKNTDVGRIYWVDWLRAFAIILVTVGHAFTCLHHKGFVRQFIYSFHMPLFMGISGFVVSWLTIESNGGLYMLISDVRRFLARKFCAIIVPYLMWCLVVPFVVTSDFSVWATWTETAENVLVHNTALWFLPCLFLQMVSFALYCYLSPLKWARSVPKRSGRCLVFDVLKVIAINLLVVIFYVVSGNSFVRSWASYMLPFFLGVFVAKYRLHAMFGNLIVLISTGIAFVVMGCAFAHYALIQGDGCGVCKALRMVTGLLGIVVFFGIFPRLTLKRMLARILSFIGKRTLVIYANNFPLIAVASFLSVDQPWKVLLSALVISIVVLCQDILISLLIERSHLLSCLLLGKKWYVNFPKHILGLRDK